MDVESSFVMRVGVCVAMCTVTGSEVAVVVALAVDPVQAAARPGAPSRGERSARRR